MLKKSSIGATGLVIVAILFIGILLLSNLYLRGAKVDLTADGRFTVADGTERIVQSLTEPVNLYFFFSEKAAESRPDIRSYANRVQELLEELESRSEGKLTLKVIDPLPFSEEEDRASELGIDSVPINASGERMYLGLAGTNSTDGKESIPQLNPRLEEQLEYDVAKLIYKLSSAKKPVIGWLSSLPMQGDFNMQTGQQSPPWVVYGQLEQLYSLRNVDAATLTEVDPEINVLVLVHPKNLPPPALYAIDQFTLRGGHVLVFVDPSAQQDRGNADPGDPMAQFQMDRSSNLQPLLSAWGVDYDPGQVVVDLERGLPIQLRPGEPPTQHIGIIGLESGDMARDAITANLNVVNFATAGSLKASSGSKLTFEPLARTSKQAGLLPAQRLALANDPGSLRDGFKPTGEFVVAARITGTAPSAFPDGPPAGAKAPAAPLKESAQPINVVVVADTDLMTDMMWVQVGSFLGQAVAQPFANNGEFVWNAVDNLGGSNDLVSIRARAPYHRPFEVVEAMRRNAEAELRVREQKLQEEIQQIDSTLQRLQTAQPGASEAILSSELTQQIESFQEKRATLRKQLRGIRAGLNADIASLGWWVKAGNVLGMPLIVTAVGLFVALWRKRRRQAVAMLRKGSAA